MMLRGLAQVSQTGTVPGEGSAWRVPECEASVKASGLAKRKKKKVPQTPLHPHPKGRRERESAFPLEGRGAWRVWGKAARRPCAESAAPSLARGEGGDPHRRTSEPGTTDIPLMPAMSPELGPRLLPASCHSPGPHPGLYRGSRARPCHAPSSPHRPHGAPPLRVPISPLHSEPRTCRPQARPATRSPAPATRSPAPATHGRVPARP